MKERNLVSDSKVSKHLGFFRNGPRDTRQKIYVSFLHSEGMKLGFGFENFVTFRLFRK